jgi:methylmalonyl-CoA mutase N-terminal domain/subunit
LALVADTFRFCNAELPNWNPISISGYHIREAGATAVQELAFTFANAMEYVRRAVDAGLAVDTFAPRLSFFFAAHNDLFEEAAKFRAARRMYARLMRERFGASDASCRLRFHTQTGGVTLQAQQPLNNVVRVAVQALASVLGGTQSLHTNSYDEALSLPSEQAATIALRTQQILAHESGVASTADPLAGSYYVEHLTTALETGAMALLARVDALGGAAKAIGASFFQEEIARSAYEHQQRVERGETVIVGVNKFSDGSPVPEVPAPDYSRLEREQVDRLKGRKASRNAKAVAKALKTLGAAAAGLKTGAALGSTPVVPLIVDAVRARTSVGEIAATLRECWGVYQPS